MVPKTLYPQPLIQSRALVTLLVLNLLNFTARKLKAHQSGQWLVINTNTPPKIILNGAKIKLNSLVRAWISTDPTATLIKIELYRKGEQNEKYSELLGIPAINLNWQNSGYQMTSLISTHLHFNTTSDKPKV